MFQRAKSITKRFRLYLTHCLPNTALEHKLQSIKCNEMFHKYLKSLFWKIFLFYFRNQVFLCTSLKVLASIKTTAFKEYMEGNWSIMVALIVHYMFICIDKHNGYKCLSCLSKLLFKNTSNDSVRGSFMGHGSYFGLWWSW